MPTTDSTDDLRVSADVDLSCALPLSSPLTMAAVPLPLSSVPTAAPCDSDIENRAASMANTDCNKALSSPAEASPAKLTSTSPAPSEGSRDTSLSTSRILSAADSLPCHGTNIINVEKELTASLPPSTPFGDVGENDYPAKLTFKGITVTLESSKVWNDFHKVGTEMIVTRPGRHMFPYCRYRIAGLDPDRRYSMVLSIPPADTYKYRWCGQKWEVAGSADHLSQGLIRAFAHHYSPSTGAEWMKVLISFKKLKLTNNGSDQEGNIILYSLHRYIPRLHIIPVPDSMVPSTDQPVVMGPESMTFTFPHTEFMAVTTYQNFRITQMKIRYNPFAKGFREDGCNPRLQRVVNRKIEFVNVETAGASATAEKEPDQSSTEHFEQERQMILKPIMSRFSESTYVQCRGKHALGNLVLVQTPTQELKKQRNCPINLTPPMKLCVTMSSKAKFKPPSTSRLLPKYKKKRKYMNWGYAVRKEWRSEAQAPSPPLASVQPELDDVERLLFVSFTSKSALDSHIGDQPIIKTSSQSATSETPVQLQLNLETGCLESEDDKLLRLEIQLIQDLQVLKHRQAIHPALQKVGLKLSSLDPSQPVNLQYLGVELPNLSTDGDGGSSFISRTGKTSDVTKIKGWRRKFVRSENLPHSNENLPDGSGSKNLSAFCSNMLDEYLETEEQQISERAEAFSTQPQSPVAYELPAKSCSYVKTLDSVLKERKTPPANTSNRPCPLSSKRLCSEPLSPEPPSPSPSPALSEERDSMLPSPALRTTQNNSVAQRLSKYLSEPSPKPVIITKGNQMTNPLNLSKLQLKLHEMEVGAWNSGLKRTQLAPDRLVVALSALMTKGSHLDELFKAPKYRRTLATECGEQFCRLGCVCESLNGSLFYRDRGPFHCRRPDCMFECSCFKHKISKNLITGLSEGSSSSSYVIKNPEKLWVKNGSDSELLLVPETNTPDVVIISKAPKPNIVPKVREEDKDPVYKYLESRLTCARVREFNCKSHHVETLADLTASTAATAATTANNITSTIPAVHKIKTPTPSAAPVNSTKPTEKTPEKPTHNVFVLKKKSEMASGQAIKRPRTLIELQSTCKWAKEDRKMVLEALCLNMNRNRLCRPFSIGRYRVKPIAKVIMQKPNEVIVTYKVRISLKSNSAGSEADSDCSDGENKPRDEKVTEEKRNEREAQIPEGVTPFLSGIQPAGVLRAHTKSSKSPGLVQVNGKSYSHARLMLGRMGSLHPANRIAAFVTGRLVGSSNLYKKPANPSPTVTSAPTAPKTTPAPAAVSQPPPAPTASSQGRPALPPLKMPEQRAAKILPPQNMPPPPPPKPSPCSRDSPFQSATPVSLTVSPSLKAPSFLGQKGTYSFRLCPPDHEDRRLPGVSLPGGFTLIQLNKPDPVRDVMRQQQIQHRGRSNAQRLAQIFGYTLKSDKNNHNHRPKTINQRPIEISDDSEPEESDFSDEDEEIDVDDELSVDVESVFIPEEQQMVNRLRMAAGLGPTPRSRKFETPKSLDAESTEVCDRNYLRMCSERQRRVEHKELFENLQTILKPSPGIQSPKIHLLTMATKEIKALTEHSKYLEEKKRLLTQIQEGYIKEIALMSGKSEETIMEKLRDVCKKQKQKEQMNSDTSYSDLLQSNAAMVQAISPSSKPETTPLLPLVIKEEPVSPAREPAIEDSPTATEPPEQDPPDSRPNAAEQIQATAKNFVQQLLSKLKPIIHNAKSCHQIARARRELEEREKRGEESVSSVSSAPTASTTATSANKPQTLALPLVRTKDGRIILPSSVKPAAQTYYTLKLVNSPSGGQEGAQRPTILLQPLDPAAVKQQNLNRPGSDHRTSATITQPAQPAMAQSMVFKSPLANIGYINKSISTAMPTTTTTTTTSPVLSSNQLSVSVPQTHHHPIFHPPSFAASPVKRGRGRPRKHPLPGGMLPIGHPNLVIKEDPDFTPSNCFSQFNKRPAVQSSPQFLPAKRGRGRPPKNALTHFQFANPYSRKIKEEDEEWDIAISSSSVNATRHLTRGSLGKDFPSAKRRSWTDIEDDLDVD